MTTPELAVPPTEGDGHGGTEVEAGAARQPSVPPPFTAEEWDAINAAVWSDLEDDPTRFDDVLSTALGTLAGIALDGQTDAAALCVQTLREIEQRALWGPVHGDQEDHR